MVETVTIPILAQTQSHPTVPTTAAQEAVALPLLPVVTSVMSPIPFVGGDPLRFCLIEFKKGPTIGEGEHAWVSGRTGQKDL